MLRLGWGFDSLNCKSEFLSLNVDSEAFENPLLLLKIRLGKTTNRKYCNSTSSFFQYLLCHIDGLLAGKTQKRGTLILIITYYF